MMKVLVTGAGGQLGADVVLELQRRSLQAIGSTREDCDLTRRDQIFALVSRHEPDAIIHCAAYTAVDRAEEETALSFQVNAEATRHLAEAAHHQDAALLYVSTDYVFDGTSSEPYEVSSPTRPLNAYGRSKLEGELAVQSVLERFFVVRTSWVFGHHGNNFVKTMLRLAETRDRLSVVHDQVGSPTYTFDLARLLVDMVQTRAYGVYHATNAGSCSWYEFAREIFEQSGRSVSVTPIPTSDYPTPAKRPAHSVLSKASLAPVFAPLRPWQQALSHFLERA